MDIFTMVLNRRPISANKDPNANYTRAIREAALARQPRIANGPLYARILWFHKDPTTQDVDNIAKRILDSLEGLVFEDDSVVTHCLAARIDATVYYELSGSSPSDKDHKLLLQLLDDGDSRHVLYVR